MSRLIKFRLWDIENKKMIYSTDSYYLHALRMDMNGSLVIEDSWCTREFEIMQFTGLHDTNEKEIYEGDILQDKQKCCLALTTIELPEIDITFFKTESGTGIGASSLFNAHQMFIIGNIYENPELLEK